MGPVQVTGVMRECHVVTTYSKVTHTHNSPDAHCRSRCEVQCASDRRSGCRGDKHYKSSMLAAFSSGRFVCIHSATRLTQELRFVVEVLSWSIDRSDAETANWHVLHIEMKMQFHAFNESEEICRIQKKHDQPKDRSLWYSTQQWRWSWTGSSVEGRKLVIALLTLSSPVVSDGYPSNCSAPYWSNPPFLIFLIFGHSGA